MIFKNRNEAGRLLAPLLKEHLKNSQDLRKVIVLGLARGGVVVAAELAKVLNLPLNVVVPRKIGAPGNPELAIGAIIEDGPGVFNESLIQYLAVSSTYIQKEVEKERQVALQRISRYRHEPLPDLTDYIVILVDDGMATGVTMLATIKSLQAKGVESLIVAVPVASQSAVEMAQNTGSLVVSLQIPGDLRAIGFFYREFDQTEDEEVIRLLATNHVEASQAVESHHRTIVISIDSTELTGELTIPQHSQGLVVFVHGSGSSRFSPRNQYVAKTLNQANLATLLIDLLTVEEEREDLKTRQLRFDIPLLADRVVKISRWLMKEEDTKGLLLGYFGASTGAAAALIAAAELGDKIKAVVSRGGRPDLANEALSQVKAPTLLVVGGHDFDVIELNQEALEQLACKKQLSIVPFATHLFEEPGTLEEVSRLAQSWFIQHF